MNKTSILLGLTALVIAGAVIAPQAVLAYRGDPAVKGPNYTEERHTAMEKAFENKDYAAWQNLMQGRGRVTQVVNKDNFAKFAQAHELAEQGKTDEANKIKAELGLGLRNGTGMGQGMGYGRTSR
ncbi:hypothetical protein A2363_01780 [Candidatus Gottesmanbacteria bacterium RIFOXYB1_FULL_47_11]|uniref:Uncharacterized protein n=1 Tax=Candidatus Gottesmanbacteria bacterium RIFOXYB1_FULL_47_11 TaxID=1798401 RepID=A0A1F6BD95_9BACT|nr:MAG: hypothetical protein A2363_01780 [Candidatus Gottesmanbacteria bacterium RIFOXYB1_FULL_47_11]